MELKKDWPRLLFDLWVSCNSAPNWKSDRLIRGAALSDLRLTEAKGKLQEGLGQLNTPSQAPQTLTGTPSGSLKADSLIPVFTIAMVCTIGLMGVQWEDRDDEVPHATSRGPVSRSFVGVPSLLSIANMSPFSCTRWISVIIPDTQVHK